ncbi:MAG: hypothetical protein Q9213_001758 [Squamulea squamosa]
MEELCQFFGRHGQIIGWPYRRSAGRYHWMEMVIFTVPLYFQVTQNATALVAGARLLPGLVAYAVGGLFTGTVIAR